MPEQEIGKAPEMPDAVSEGPASDTSAPNGASAEASSPKPKFPHPKILLIDLPADVHSLLEADGYSVVKTSFGTPLIVPSSGGKGLSVLPRIANSQSEMEQEIIIVDTAAPAAVQRKGETSANEGERRTWQSAIKGRIDPRPLRMNWLRQNAFDRILEKGDGVFVVFLEDKNSVDYVIGERSGQKISTQAHETITTWGFLSILDEVESKPDSGVEYELTDLGKSIPGLASAMKESSFACTISPSFRLSEDQWVPLAKNKYGEVIAAVVLPDPEKNGAVFLLPRVGNRTKLIETFISEYFPRLSGQFYPHIQRSDWVREPPYELFEVQALEQETAAVEAETSARIKELSAAITAKREDRKFLYRLLTGTDDELVQAVQQTLELLGFNDVRDVDQEAESGNVKREDLQIMDRAPALLVEVKGISGMPKEAYALQVDKYVAPRIKEWKRFDVQGLTIINHQLGKPGLDREQERVFQDDVITHAEANDLGLVTTWELYRLVRGYLRHGWTSDQVTPVLYRNGVIRCIPEHYEQVGIIENYYEKVGVVAIRLIGTVELGDTLAFELPIEFEQEAISSMEIENEPVKIASKGDLIGVKTTLTKEQARNGIKLYRVTSTDNE